MKKSLYLALGLTLAASSLNAMAKEKNNLEEPRQNTTLSEIIKPLIKLEDLHPIGQLTQEQFDDFQNTQEILQTTRLTLVPFKHKDMTTEKLAQNFYKLYSREEVTRFVQRGTVKNIEEARARAQALSGLKNGMIWLVFENQTQDAHSEEKFLGIVGIHGADFRNSRAGLGTFFVPEAQGKGYCTEANKKIMLYLFKNTPLNTLRIGTRPDNKAMIKLLKTQNVPQVSIDGGIPGDACYVTEEGLTFEPTVLFVVTREWFVNKFNMEMIYKKEKA